MTFEMVSIARRLEAGTYQPHRAASVGARSVPERTVFAPVPLTDRVFVFALQCTLGAVAGFVLGLCFTVSP